MKTYTAKFILKVKGMRFRKGQKVLCISAHPWCGAVNGRTYKVLGISSEWHIKVRTGSGKGGTEWIHQSRFAEAK